MTKIKSVTIKGIRGVRKQLKLELNKKSVLFYGENGSGKSSIADAFEWFYENRVRHLSYREIGLQGGINALRNTFLKDDEEAAVMIEYTNENYNSKKKLFYKKDSLETDQSNSSEKFAEYLKESQNENLYLRYGGLTDFILATKKERLDVLSNIIGFSEVSKVRGALRMIVGELSREFERKRFDDQINTQQQKIIDQFGRNVNSDRQFADAVNELVESLGIDRKIDRIDEVEKILDLIKKPEDSQAIALQSFYDKIVDWALNIPVAIDEIERSYQIYYEQFEKIISDIEKVSKILLEKLLSEGINVIKENVITEDFCPLCLQPKERSKLLKELEQRIAELQQYKGEKQKLVELKGSLLKELREQIYKVVYFLSDAESKLDENKELLEDLTEIKVGFDNYVNQANIEISPRQQLRAPLELNINRNHLKRIFEFSKQKINDIKAARKDDPKFDIHSKILLSKEAYSIIQQLKKEKKILERHKKSIQVIYNEFLKKQKEGLESFFNRFSSNIDKFYQFMNPGEKIEDIKLIPLEEREELAGVTLEYKFFNNTEFPPQKYLSESHLNCLGIAFFLTSVLAFNKLNKFFILDDVISSYDSIHRKRFVDLLIEKFPDYQIIIMTHEKNWFEIVRNMVKGRNWLVNEIKWNEENGAYIDEPIKDLRERIETKIGNSEVDGLGNDFRIYLEHILKQIACNLEVKMKFLFNDENEKRMSNELFSDLKIRLKNTGLNENTTIDRLSSSLFILNLESHDNKKTFNASIRDFKACWEDVKEFENLFFCDSCGKFITFSRDHGSRNKRLACRCGSKEYK